MRRLLKTLFGGLCIGAIVALVFGGIEQHKAAEACKAMGHDYGKVNYNPRKSYYCRDTTRYWVTPEGLVKDD